jgi:acyl-CoA synthetase (AMP-forming)/AMP-acid ligase II
LIMTTTIFERFQQIYASDADRTAVHLLFSRQPTQHLTYAELTQGSAGYAHALEETGIRPGEVVILILQHSEALLWAFFGSILHGAIPSIMPFLTEKLSPDQYRQSLSALIEITAPAAIITYPEFLLEVARAVLPGSPVRSVLTSEQIAPIPHPDFASLCGAKRLPQDIVLLQHSSGTTGLQKGVALSHQAIFNQIDTYAQAISLSHQDVVVSWLPLYHDMGLIAGFLLPILNRIPLVLMSPFDWVRAPYRLMQAVSQYHGTLSWLPNFAYNFCARMVRERDLEGIDLSGWRAVINCSEPMHYKSHQLFLERFQAYGLRPSALATCYAMAENVFAVSQGGIGQDVHIDTISQSRFINDRAAHPAVPGEQAIQMVSAGQPLANTKVCVLDERREPLPDRQVGEIAIQSNCMLTGYYKRDDLTRQAFHNGWFLTGDLGYMAAGHIYVTGRKKDIIIVGGKNIYPQDLENLAGDIPGVHPGRVVAFGVENEEIGTEEVVLVAEYDGDEAGEQKKAEIAEEIRRRVNTGSDIALRYVKVVDRGWLLKTSSGKVARRANREKYLSEKNSQSFME